MEALWGLGKMRGRKENILSWGSSLFMMAELSSELDEEYGGKREKPHSCSPMNSGFGTESAQKRS